MSEQTDRVVPRPAFITEREWETFDQRTKDEWHSFETDVAWLCEQPRFRRFIFAILNDPRFCGTDQSPVRETPEKTFHAIGIQDAGRAIRLVLQSAAPRMWMRTLHDAFNAASKLPPDGKE